MKNNNNNLVVLKCRAGFHFHKSLVKTDECWGLISSTSLENKNRISPWFLCSSLRALGDEEHQKVDEVGSEKKHWWSEMAEGAKSFPRHKTNKIMIIFSYFSNNIRAYRQPNILNPPAAAFRPAMRISWVFIIIIINNILVILSFWEINHSAQSHGSSPACEDTCCTQTPPKYPTYLQLPAVSWMEVYRMFWHNPEQALDRLSWVSWLLVSWFLVWLFIFVRTLL